jgi:GTP-binding protein HflX
VTIENLFFLLSDTVGFIRKLPTQLVESFKSTLDELREADVLLHVVDISHPNFEDHIAVVRQTLIDIGAGDKETILVFNKIDAFKYVKKEEDDLTPMTRENLSLEELKKTCMKDLHQQAVFISAQKKKNIEEFKKTVYEVVKKIHVKRFPYNNLYY